MKQMKMMRDDKKPSTQFSGHLNFIGCIRFPISLLCVIYVIESCCFLGMYDCHVVSCDTAEFREVDSRPIPRVK